MIFPIPRNHRKTRRVGGVGKLLHFLMCFLPEIFREIVYLHTDYPNTMHHNYFSQTNFMSTRLPLSLMVALIFPFFVQSGWSQDYSWQKPHAKILPNGDLQWAPEPFVFETGDVVRYIDYENGDDNASGESPTEAWKHHPWDQEAGGNAAQASGPITYVFKGGVAYRGQLLADESGEPGNPIRLTVDPNWGSGRGWFWGSAKVPAQWVRATEVDHPERLPEPEKVWAIDVREIGIEPGKDGLLYNQPGLHPSGRDNNLDRDDTYAGLYVIEDGDSFRTLHLARTPDWQPMGENFAMDYWHTTDAEVIKENEEGQQMAKGFKDDIWAGKDLPADYFTDGYIWIGYRSLMGTPTPAKIPAMEGSKKRGQVPFFDPREGSLMKKVAPYGHGKGGLPYMIENLPQFLDSAGEFYVTDEGILFLRLEDGVDPNDLHLEMTSDQTAIRIHNQSHIEISGLGFAFGIGNTIDIENSVTHVNLHHLLFRNVRDVAISAVQNVDEEKFHIMDKVRVADCDFQEIGTTSISIKGTDTKWKQRSELKRGDLKHVDVLRNNIYRTGIRHRSSRWSNVSALEVVQAETGEIAGNIIQRSFGSGLVVFGGKTANSSFFMRNADEPLVRILVHHNKTDDTALGVNDYGGLALWQGGPMYAFSNNIGNSPGHMPAGLFGSTQPRNLSYPLYLDGAYKQYCFNNIIWGRTVDPEDPYANTTPGYFMVFGFLNQFINNTLYRQAKGIGGSSGNRNDIAGNIFSEVTDTFIASNRTGDPSLVGGGDDASSGLRGIPTLAYKGNIFHGPAEAGYLIRERALDRLESITKTIEAQTIAELAEDLKQFPLRIGELGRHVEQKPIVGAPEGQPITELSEQVSFHPTEGSPAIDAGGIYFMPWSLYGTVGEWNFTENHAEPTVVVDYGFYFSDVHYWRSMYEQVPSYDITLNSATLEDYQAGVTEDWARSAMAFDGQRFGSVSDDFMRQDFKINLGNLDRATRRDTILPGEPWVIDEPSGENGKYTAEDWMTYPGSQRKTLIITTQNLLMEAIFQTSASAPMAIAGKHDGRNGYLLRITEDGKAQLQISSNGETSAVTTADTVTDGNWRHVLAEVDRETGQMTIYLDGRPSGQTKAQIAADASLDTSADFLVGKTHEDSMYFAGSLDFLRVCQGTLEDSRTSIEELYEWQTNGPFRSDFMGNEPRGQRDAGAMEALRE